MPANYRVFVSFSPVCIILLLFCASNIVIGQPKNKINWLDSAKKLPPDKSLKLINKTVQSNEVPAYEKSRLLLLGGTLFTDLARYDSALIYLNRSLQASTTLKDSAGIANCYYQTGLVYSLQSKHKESIVVQQKAFVLYQKVGNNDGSMNSLLSLGNSNVKLKKYTDAKQFYKQTLERAQRNSAFKQMAIAYDGLANIYEAQKDFRNAIASVRLMQGAYDSIATREHKEEVSAIEDKYSTLLEEKDRQLVEMEAKHRQVKTDRLLRLIERDDIRLTFYSVALALTFVVFCLTIAWLVTQRNAKSTEMKLRRERASIKTANEQFEIISRQIHDELSGNLNDISFSTRELISKKSHEDIASAAQHVKGIGESLIGNMMDLVWLINPNIRSLDSLIAYIKEQANIFLKQSGINYMIVVPDRTPNVQLTSLERVNLYVVTRELIHYSVERSKATGLTLSITLEGRQLIFKIKDNSTPVDESTVKKRGEELKPLRERMEQIDGTIGLVMEQGAMVVIYRKDLP
jgi:signal transduction histidine kinase